MKRIAQNGEKVDDSDEKLKQAVILVALRTGLLKKCPEHAEIYDPGQHDFQGACMVATYLINSGDPIVAPFLGDRGPLMDSLRVICKSYGKACPVCSPPASG